jgi:hypothetical protein
VHVGLPAAFGPDRDTVPETFAQGIAAGFGMPLAHAREIAVRGDERHRRTGRRRAPRPADGGGEARAELGRT